MKKILAFSGSNSSKSINQALVASAAKLINNAEVDVIDLRDYDAPIYSQDIEAESGMPERITKLFELISSYDALVIATPEHNGYITAFFKNTLDWLSRVNMKYLDGKDVVLLSTSPGGYGGANTVAKLSGTLAYTGANVVSTYSLGGFFDKFDNEAQKISDSEELAKLQAALDKLETVQA